MSICQAPLRVSWGDRVSSSVMKLWQMDAGRFPIQPVRTLCPDYEAGTLSGNTHTHISKLSECTQIAIGELTWMELCLNFADYTSFLYPSSHSVWCYFVSERASQSPGEARRARNCMSHATQRASQWKVFINSSTHARKWRRGWGANTFHPLSNIIIITNNPG